MSPLRSSVKWNWHSGLKGLGRVVQSAKWSCEHELLQSSFDAFVYGCKSPLGNWVPYQTAPLTIHPWAQTEIIHALPQTSCMVGTWSSWEVGACARDCQHAPLLRNHEATLIHTTMIIVKETKHTKLPPTGNTWRFCDVFWVWPSRLQEISALIIQDSRDKTQGNNPHVAVRHVHCILLEMPSNRISLALSDICQRFSGWGEMQAIHQTWSCLYSTRRTPRLDSNLHPTPLVGHD